MQFLKRLRTIFAPKPSAFISAQKAKSLVTKHENERLAHCRKQVNHAIESAAAQDGRYAIKISAQYVPEKLQDELKFAGYMVFNLPDEIKIEWWQ